MEIRVSYTIRRRTLSAVLSTAERRLTEFAPDIPSDEWHVVIDCAPDDSPSVGDPPLSWRCVVIATRGTEPQPLPPYPVIYSDRDPDPQEPS